MAEYIDRQEIIDTINARRRVAATRKDFIGMIVLNYMLDVITNDACVPAADVRPERHGEWVERSDGGEGYVCDNCNGGYTLYNETPYCPNCGAKMDGGEENGKIR